MIRSNEGYCHCCRSETTFQAHAEWLRDHYVCANCGSIPRQRGINHVLDNYLPGWETLSVHESSPSHDFVARHCPGYSSSFYFESVKPGTTDEHGRRSEDLQALTFADSTFDILVTQDVFEHIFDPAAAACEIGRVLKPGGCHVFTAPKYSFIQTSFPRMSVENGKLVHLHAEEYHGSPVGDGRSLVTWTYGQDFEDVLAQWSGMNTVTYVTRDRGIGMDGEHLEVFVTRKPLSG